MYFMKLILALLLYSLYQPYKARKYFPHLESEGTQGQTKYSNSKAMLKQITCKALCLRSTTFPASG